MYTDAELYQMYLDGLISYWDYLFNRELVGLRSVQQALAYANQYVADGSSITSMGREIAIEILTYQGRTSQIPGVPGGGEFPGWLLPVGALAVVGTVGYVATRKRR